MDLEKVRTGLQEIQSEQEEQNQSTETPSAWDRFVEHPFETIGEAVTNRSQMQAKYAQDTSEVASEMAQGAVNTASDIATAYQEAGQRWHDFQEQGAELQQAYSPEALAEANETGDYSVQNAAVEDIQSAGDAFTTSARNLALSPGRQVMRSFVNTYDDDSDSFLSETAHSVASSNAGIEYLMTDEERLQKAKTISDKTGIPVEAFLADTKAFSQAMDIYHFAVKNDVLQDDLWQEYPELQNVASMSPHDAAIALHHMDDIRTTHGIIKTFTHFLEVGNKNLEYNNLQYKIFMGTADDNDRQRAADLREQLEQETKKAPSFFSDPAAAIAAGVAQSAPEMWQSTVQALDDAAVMASVAMIAGAAAGSAAGGIGAIPAGAVGAIGGGLYGFGRSLLTRQGMRTMAKAGLEAGARVGAFRGMLRPEVGQRYAEYKELKDKDGNPLLTDDEAKVYALAGGAANAGIELANFGVISKAFTKAPHASKVFADIIRNTSARMEANEAFRLMARDKAADMFKVTLSESGEEALQSVSDDLVHNRMVAGRNAQEGAYDFSTIAGNAFQSFAESLPGSLGFGLASGFGGGISSAGVLGVQMRNRAKFAAEYGSSARRTINGTLMLEQLQQAISSGKMREKAPATQQQILKTQLVQTEYQDSYIDTEIAMQGKNGMEDLQKAAKAGGYSDEDLQMAIAEKGHLLVPTERLAQEGTSPELMDAVTFKPEDESLGRMRANAKATIKEVQKQEKEAIDRQTKLFDTIVDEYYPTDESGTRNKAQRDLLKAVIFTNAQNPSQGWRKMYQETRAQLDEILKPAMDALKSGMGNAGLGEVTDEVGNKKTVYTSDNAPWYRNFYKAYKRRPTQEELEDMAVALMTGDSSAPQVQGFVITTQEEQEAAQTLKPEIDSLRHTLDGLQDIKKAATSLTGAEMQITEGLSKEAYHVYKDLTQKLIDVDGNIKGKNARQARMGALLVARHADRWAEVMSKNTGKKLTALDWYRSFAVSNSENPQHAANTGVPYATMNQVDTKMSAKEVADIKERYQYAGIYLKTPYGAKTKFSEADWLRIHSTEFKEKYGDWESAAVKKALMTQPAVKITETLHDDDVKVLRKKAAQKYKELFQDENGQPRSVTDRYSNAILMANSGFREMKSHSADGTTLSIIPNLENMIQSAYLYESDRNVKPENKKKRNVIAFHYYAVKVNIKGRESIFRFVVREETSGKRFYDGEVNEYKDNKKEGNSAEAGPATNAGGPQKKPSSVTHSIQHWWNKVKINDVKVKLDRNGEPVLPTEILEQRAWHGSPYEFNAFDLGAIGTGEGAQAHGWGLYFSKGKRVAQKYKKFLGNGIGKLYAVEVPDNENLLDEQKRFSEQTKAVQQNLVKAIESLNAEQKQTFMERFVGNSSENSSSRITITANQEVSRLSSLIGALQQLGDGDSGSRFRRNIALKQLKKNGFTSENIEYLKNNSEAREKEINEQRAKLQEAQKTLEAEQEKDKIRISKFYQGLREDILGTLKKYGYEGKHIYESLGKTLEDENHLGGDKAASSLLEKYGIQGITYDGQQDGRCFVVFDDKAVQIIERYNQAINQQERLGITSTYTDGFRIVSLLEHANESTFMHEMAHVFLLDLKQLASIDSVSAHSLELVNEWATWQKGAAHEYRGTPWAKEFANREQAIIDAEAAGDLERAEQLKEEWRQERFARAFEIYLRDGKAPAKGLKAVFRAFAKFLRHVYLAFTSDGGRASEQVRRVMDRMIATEDEIDAAALDDRYKDVSKAGGEKLFNESEKETYQRWWQESLEEAKEKLRKIVFKDLTEERQKEFDRRVAMERARKEKELQGENVFIAMRAVQETGFSDMSIVLNWFSSEEEFIKAVNALGANDTVEKALDAWMKDYKEALDKELLQAEITDDEVDKAMMGSGYRAKLEVMTGKAFAKKQALIRTINNKVQQAMRSVEDKLDAMPDDVDLKMDKNSNAVKELWKAISRLRVSSKWSADEQRHIESLLKSATKEEARKQYQKFKEKVRQQEQQKKQKQETEEETFRATEDEMRQFRQQAKELIAKKPLHEAMDVYNFKRIARQQARRARMLARKEIWESARLAHRAQIVAMLEAEEAQKMRERVQKHLNQLKKKLNSRSVRLPQQERYWLRHLAFELGMTNRDAYKPHGTESQTPEQIMSINFLFKLFDQLAEQHDIPDAEGPKAVIDFLTRKTETADGKEFTGKKWKQLNIAEFENAIDTLNILYTTGRDKFRMKSIGGKDIQDVLDEITGEEASDASHIHVQRKRVEDDKGGLAYNDWLGALSPALAQHGQDYIAGMIKPEEILRALGHAAHKYIYGLYERAAQKEGKMVADEMAQLKAILQPFSHSERREWQKKKYLLVTADGREMMSKENIICMALNRGNNTNWMRLLGGLGMESEDGPQKLAKFIDEHMTEKDWDMVQTIWDNIGQYWNETVAVEEKLNGVALQKVQPVSFWVDLSDGTKKQLRGGYYPIAYDPKKSTRQADLSNNAELRTQMSGAQVFGAGRGFTKGRSEYNVKRPLLLDFTVITSHVQQVVHNIAYRVAARDVYRLINSHQFEDYVTGSLGRPFYNVLREWSTDVWAQIDGSNNVAANNMDKFVNYFRRNSVMAIMGYRLWPALENVSNIGPVIEKLGPIRTMRVLLNYPFNWTKNKRLLYKSVFMKNRINSMDRDIGSQDGLFQADYRPFEIIRAHAYDLMLYSDLAMSAPLWVQSYKDFYQDTVNEVQKENQRKVQAIVDAQKAVDDLKAERLDLQKKMSDMNMYMDMRQNGTPEQQEQAKQSPFAVHNYQELHDIKVSYDTRSDEIEKELREAKDKLNRTADLEVLTNDEVLQEGERRAVAKADAVIRDTFGSGETKDLASVQRQKHSLYRLMTTFYSFFNTQFNALFAQYRHAVHGPANENLFRRWAPLMKGIFYRIVVMSLVGYSLKFALGLDGSGDDDKWKKVKDDSVVGGVRQEEVPWQERYLKGLFENMVSTATGGFVGLRDVATFAMNYVFDDTTYGRTINPFETGFRAGTEVWRAMALLARMGKKNLEIDEQETKREETYQEQLKKKKGKKRTEFIKKHEEAEKYRQPPHRITYSEVGRHAANALASATAARTGVTSTVIDSITGTMQYMNDTDNRYDNHAWRIVWSALFDKKPAEREVPKQPAKPKEDKKKKKKK